MTVVPVVGMTALPEPSLVTEKTVSRVSGSVNVREITHPWPLESVWTAGTGVNAQQPPPWFLTFATRPFLKASTVAWVGHEVPAPGLPSQLMSEPM